MAKIESGYFYISYLVELKDKIFKILPLFEEENKGVYKHIDTLLVELYNLEKVFEKFEAKVWYISTLATLESFKAQNLNSKVIRSDVFRIINLIDKEIQRRKECV